MIIYADQITNSTILFKLGQPTLVFDYKGGYIYLYCSKENIILYYFYQNILYTQKEYKNNDFNHTDITGNIFNLIHVTKLLQQNKSKDPN